MLNDSKVMANIPAGDLKRARDFYADKLGLTPAQEFGRGGPGLPDRRRHRLPDLPRPIRRPGRAHHRPVPRRRHRVRGARPQGQGRHVRGLRPARRPVGRRDRRRIEGMGRAAWFKDSEGNTMCIDEPTPASDQPQTSSAVSTISASLAICSSRVSELPSTVEEKPHCPDRASCSSGTNLDGLVDAALEVVLALELRALRRHQAEDDALARRHEPQRLEPAGAGVVVLQEEAVDLQPAEQRLGDEVVAALGHPRGAEVAAAHVRGDRQRVRAAGERGVDLPDVALVQVLGVAALRGELGALLGVVEVGQAGVVELQVGARPAPRCPAPAGSRPPTARPRTSPRRGRPSDRSPPLRRGSGPSTATGSSASASAPRPRPTAGRRSPRRRSARRCDSGPSTCSPAGV